MNIRSKKVAVIIDDKPLDVKISISEKAGVYSVKLSREVDSKRWFLTLKTEEVGRKSFLLPKDFKEQSYVNDSRDGGYWADGVSVKFDWSNGLNRGIQSSHTDSARLIKNPDVKSAVGIGFIKASDIKKLKIALEAVKVAIKGNDTAKALEQIVRNTEQALGAGKSK